MRNSANLKHIALCGAFILNFSASVCAEPIIVQENEHMAGGILGASPPATVPFGLSVYQPTPNGTLTYLAWNGQYAPSDMGKTFVAPPEVVEGANRARASTSSEYYMQTGGGNFTAGRGFSIPGHYITSVERIIDQLAITQPTLGGSYVLSAKQRIRFWGEPIPPLPGDFNQNGRVDTADYALWRNQNDMDGSLPNESGLTPFDVTPEDYDFWRANYGRSVVPTIATGNVVNSIPEPRLMTQTALVIIYCFTHRILFGHRRPRFLLAASSHSGGRCLCGRVAGQRQVLRLDREGFIEQTAA